jgi:ferredoxin
MNPRYYCIRCQAYHKTCPKRAASIQVTRISWKDALQVQRIPRSFNVSNIQTFRLRNRTLVFIHRRSDKPNRTLPPFCLTCKQHVKTDAQFCSIVCAAKHRRERRAAKRKQASPQRSPVMTSAI